MSLHAPEVELESAPASSGDPGALRDRFARDGYLYAPGLLPADACSAVREALLESLEAATPAAVAAVERGETPPTGDPRPFLDGRPGEWTDGLGATDTVTAWVALQDVPRGLGGLAVLPGSHRHGLRPVVPAVGAGDSSIPGLSDDPRWASTEYATGDVLLFHSLTVHGSTPHTLAGTRVSCDYRFQRLSEPVGDLSVRPVMFPGVASFDEFADGWTDTSPVAVPAGAIVVDTVHPLSPELEPGPSLLLAASG